MQLTWFFDNLFLNSNVACVKDSPFFFPSASLPPQPCLTCQVLGVEDLSSIHLTDRASDQDFWDQKWRKNAPLVCSWDPVKPSATLNQETMASSPKFMVSMAPKTRAVYRIEPNFGFWNGKAIYLNPRVKKPHRKWTDVIIQLLSSDFEFWRNHSYKIQGVQSWWPPPQKAMQRRDLDDIDLSKHQTPRWKVFLATILDQLGIQICLGMFEP